MLVFCLCSRKCTIKIYISHKDGEKMAQKKSRNQKKKVYRYDKSKPDTKKKGRGENEGKQQQIKEAPVWPQYIPYLIIVFTILLSICLYSDDIGKAGNWIRDKVLFGLNGVVSYAFPAFVVLMLISYFVRRPRRLGRKAAVFSLLYLFSSVLAQIFTSAGETPDYFSGKPVCPIGGGFLGGSIGDAFRNWFGRGGASVIVIAVLIVLLLVGFSVEPKSVLKFFVRIGRRIKAAFARAKESYSDDDYDDMPEDNAVSVSDGYYGDVPAEEEKRVQKFKFKKEKEKVKEVDIPLDDDEGQLSINTETSLDPETESEIEERIYEEVMRKTKSRKESESSESEDELTEEDAAEDSQIEETEEEKTEDDQLIKQLSEAFIEEEEPKREYVFPPIDLLAEDLETKEEDIKDEMHNNAVKLVETLRSFNVKTKIDNVSRGPTITRYELLPEAGTRVRSIVNLYDDISLNLATAGLRIEAPIPGKAAVGIEVPNRNRAIVYLRTLLENDEFRNAKSKLTCALGENVGGEPVYLDIAKMPHLLIAGATGMGKSVCINSLIVSLLYNAKPEEVKLILIDPKKVELTIYNGIPHLLVPVVSDPKKAAGSLSWAVAEMERRFSLIEEVGARDIRMYNKFTENDPSYEFMPYIVIIIDELADLMMTAPADVESSVCRLMQKARAAGMHVIIGTQRPSVDVITGLIKANIPSRIAFTVASQVDSRTIIDRAGAENLIGKGDMLYYPVSDTKPSRVQGSFVSEEDVIKIVEFIKEANDESNVESAERVMKEIEKEAAKCGTGKKGEAGDFGDDEEEDPKLREALELAVNSGKISTSLIQRRLSLGYGRAAKLIDRMEQLGYVGAPEGQKPREVLISKEQFMEMIMKNDDNISEE